MTFRKNLKNVQKFGSYSIVELISRFVFLPLMMQCQRLEIWCTLRTSVPGENMTTKIGYLVNTSRMDLSVLVIWYIFTVFMSRAFRASWMSSSGTFGGIPFSTSRVWRVSGSGHI